MDGVNIWVTKAGILGKIVGMRISGFVATSGHLAIQDIGPVMRREQLTANLGASRAGQVMSGAGAGVLQVIGSAALTIFNVAI